ncbi:MAG: tetratricopeptide repeat protein [Polyangiaceae bacterium]
MDVRCSRCATEYEFDDALISERGTTVKCTNCGYQFKIYPGEGKGLAPERWVVRTVSGRELVYTSLRELQRGIADKKVGANDLLSRGKQVARPLGSIAELEPFFRVLANKKPTDEVREQRTLHGVAPPAKSLGLNRGKGYSAPEPQAPRSEPPPPPSRVAESMQAAFTPAASNLEMSAAPAIAPLPATQLPEPTPTPVAADAIPDPRVMARPEAFEPSPLSSSLRAGSSSDSRTTLPGGSPTSITGDVLPGRVGSPFPVRPPSDSVPDSARVSVARAPISSRITLDTTLEVPRSPVSSPRNLPPIEVANIRDSFKSYDELQLDPRAEDHHARIARSRWIAGVVVVGVLGLLGSTVGRRYLAQLTGAVEVKATSDARVAKFLSDGSRMADEGDFEGAKEEFDKATALAEKDRAVLTALARLETLRADVSWLKLRLLDPNSTDLVQATYRELGRRVGKTRTAVDRAFAVSPEDPAVLRARVDSLRLSGEGDRAREWLAPLSANASVPENAYVLAALDLAEPNPVWPTAIDRLRTAAAAERDPGRARAALIYALVRANRLPEADSEFSKLDGRSKPHPLLEELRAFLKRAKQSESAGERAPKIATVDTSKLPKLDTSPVPEDEPRPAAAGTVPSDFRAKLSQAAAALRNGDLTRAEQLFNGVLADQPSNTEAISGLGDVAKARRDPALAAKMYDRVLADNPSYLPAILASADQKWEAGDTAGALVLYHRLLDQAGANSEYGGRASARIAQAAGGSGGGPPVVETVPVKPEAPAVPPAAVDTTDLTGAGAR